MCGRYTLAAPADLLADLFGVPAPEEPPPPRFNVAPTQTMPVVPNLEPRRLVAMRWGLVPRWAKDASIGNRLINARSETAAEKPSFRDALRKRRCLVPADGFYEWSGEGKERFPLLVRRRDGTPLGMAGLWESWTSPEGEILDTFTLLTTSPNELMVRFHDRMPVILGPESWDRWLAPTAVASEEVLPLLVPCPADWLEAVPVSRAVNSPRTDSSVCIEPAGDVVRVG
jgi:putative SOS response-associated peptidase YedK